MDYSNIFPPFILEYYVEGMEEVLEEDAFASDKENNFVNNNVYGDRGLNGDNDNILKSASGVAVEDLLDFYDVSSSETFYEADIDRLVIDGFPDTIQTGEQTKTEQLNLSGIYFDKAVFETIINTPHPNLRTLDVSNSNGIYDEECLLKLFKLVDSLPNLEHINISYVEFESPKYKSNMKFANELWKTLAKNALVNMPKLNRITAYGFPIKYPSHAIEIMNGGVGIEAITHTMNGAETILKAVEDSEIIQASNLCDTWSRLINRKSTLAVLNDGTCRNDMFLDSLVPLYIKVDVSSLDGIGIEHYMGRVSTEEAIVTFFPYFCARGRQSNKKLDKVEKSVLYDLCERADKDLQKEKFEALSCEIEFLARTLFGGCEMSTNGDFHEKYKRVSGLIKMRRKINKK